MRCHFDAVQSSWTLCEVVDYQLSPSNGSTLCIVLSGLWSRQAGPKAVRDLHRGPGHGLALASHLQADICRAYCTPSACAGRVHKLGPCAGRELVRGQSSLRMQRCLYSIVIIVTNTRFWDSYLDLPIGQRCIYQYLLHIFGYIAVPRSSTVVPCPSHL